MRWVRGFVALGAAVAAAGLIALPASGAKPPGVPWTELLPALPSPSQTHPNRVAHCRRANLGCVRFQIRRMRELRARLGCDHRGVFATTYLQLTRQARDALVAGPRLMRWPRFCFGEDALLDERVLPDGALVGARARGAGRVADRL